MRLYKRPNTPNFWYSFTIDGVRYRESTGTANKAIASAIASKAYENQFLKKKFGQKEDIQLRYALGKYYQEHASSQVWAGKVKCYVREMGEFWGLDTALSEIDNKHVGEFVQYLRIKTLKVWNPRSKKWITTKKTTSGSTINRYLASFRKMYYLAKDVWGVKVGEINFRLHRQREPDSRNRWATPEEITRILEHASPHLRNIILFALYTGVRSGNNLGLKWSQVDLAGRTISFKVKDKNKQGGKYLSVPMVEPCYTMLKRLSQKKQNLYVFTYDGRPVTSVKTAWAAACRRAGVSGLRIHDLRRTCGSWLEQSGVPLKLIKEIFGHADIKTTMGYVHHAETAKREALQTLFSAQNWHNEKPAKLKEVV